MKIGSCFGLCLKFHLLWAHWIVNVKCYICYEKKVRKKLKRTNGQNPGRGLQTETIGNLFLKIHTAYCPVALKSMISYIPISLKFHSVSTIISQMPLNILCGFLYPTYSSGGSNWLEKKVRNSCFYIVPMSAAVLATNGFIIPTSELIVTREHV